LNQFRKLQWSLDIPSKNIELHIEVATYTVKIDESVVVICYGYSNIANMGVALYQIRLCGVLKNDL
jgi:hypothetical protein